MPGRFRTALALVLLATPWQLTLAQQVEDAPKVLPSRPLSRAELDRREALKRFGLGLKCERENRFLEAMTNFEEAARLDPDANAAHKALVPLYLAVERIGDALAECRKTLDLDPDDHETWYLCSRLHQGRGETKDAARCLARALACPNLKEQQTDLYVQIATDLGLLREELKDYAGAIAALTKVTEILEAPVLLMETGPFTRKEVDGRAAEVYERMAGLHVRLKQFDQAASALTRAQKKDPDVAARLSLHLAKIRQAQDRPAEALRAVDDYLTVQPQETEAYELKIALLRKLGRDAEILPALRAAAERDAHNLSLQLLLAGRYAQESLWDESEAAYKSVIRESPTSEAYRGLFQLYKQQGESKVKEVLEDLDKAIVDGSTQRNGDEEKPGRAFAAYTARAMLAVISNDPELVRALLKAAETELNARRSHHRRTWHYLALLALRTNQLDSAERLYRQCLATVTAGDPQELEVYGGMLRVLQQQRKFEEIIPICQRGLKECQRVNLLFFYRMLANAYAQLGKFDEALEAAAKGTAISDDDNRLDSQTAHAQILSLAGRHDKAIAECLALLKETEAPSEVKKVRYALAGVYSGAHQYAKAEEQLRLILETTPSDAPACNDLGYIMADQAKDLEEAERLIRLAIKIDSEQKRKKTGETGGDISVDDLGEHAAYVDSLGWVLFRRGQLPAARTELEKAVKLPEGAEDPVIWDHLGDVCLRLGQQERAREAFGKAVRLYEVGRRRQADDQYKELKQKLRLLEP